MNLDVARKLWLSCGGTVVPKRRTGEEVYFHPDIVKRITVNRRRKDAPMILKAALRRLLA